MKSTTRKRKLVHIGWKEYVDLPVWGIQRLKAKIDTGARTSALDTKRYVLQQTPKGLMVELHLPLGPKHPQREVVVEAPVLRFIAVRNSGGMSELRPLIEAVLQLGPVTKRIKVTLTNRARMRFRLLLGRKALEDDFLVDVSRTYVGSRQRKRPL
jgi:hypothetical protein